MPDDAAFVARDLAQRISAPERTSHLQPTWAEARAARIRTEHAATSKYPLREWAVLSEEQLARARAELGSARPYPQTYSPVGDRRPLTPDELRAARAAAGMPQATGWERDG